MAPRKSTKRQQVLVGHLAIKVVAAQVNVVVGPVLSVWAIEENWAAPEFKRVPVICGVRVAAWCCWVDKVALSTIAPRV